MGDHTIKSQRPRSVHEKRVPQEQADAAKFMAQTGNTSVTFFLFTVVNFSKTTACFHNLLLHICQFSKLILFLNHLFFFHQLKSINKVAKN